MKIRKIIDTGLIILFTLILCTFGLLVLLKPPTAISVAERRPLADRPTVTAKGFADGTLFTDTEDFLLDQFPARDLFRRVKAINSRFMLRLTDDHDIVLVKGHAAEIAIPSGHSVETFFKRLSMLAERRLGEAGADPDRIAVTLIPDKLAYLSPDVGLAGCPAPDYASLRDRMGNEAPGTYLDLFDLLTADDFYTTDAHWREEKIVDVADSLLSRMGRPTNGAFGISDVEATSSFYGVYYGRSALPLPPDDIRLVRSDRIDGARVTRLDTDDMTWKDGFLYDESKLPADSPGASDVSNAPVASGDPYDVFLGGNNALTVIEAAAPLYEGKTLCLFTDSFGRSLAPLLLAGYDRIAVYDLRYIRATDALALVSPEGADVLIAYSMSTLCVSDTLRVD